MTEKKKKDFRKISDFRNEVFTQAQLEELSLLYCWKISQEPERKPRMLDLMTSLKYPMHLWENFVARHDSEDDAYKALKTIKRVEEKDKLDKTLDKLHAKLEAELGKDDTNSALVQHLVKGIADMEIIKRGLKGNQAQVQQPQLQQTINFQLSESQMKSMREYKRSQLGKAEVVQIKQLEETKPIRIKAKE